MFSFTEFVAFIFFILLYCLSFICFSLLPYFIVIPFISSCWFTPVLSSSVSSAGPDWGLVSGLPVALMVLRKAPGGAESSAPRCGSSCVQEGRLSLWLWTVAPPGVAPLRWLLLWSGLRSWPCLYRGRRTRSSVFSLLFLPSVRYFVLLTPSENAL